MGLLILHPTSIKPMKTTLTVVLLLVASNTFMTIAWYGHLKYRNVAAHYHGCRQLADCATGVQLPGAGQSDWLWSVHRNAVEGDSGGGVAVGVRGLRVPLSRRAPRPGASAAAFLLIIAAVALVRGDGPKEKGEGENKPAEVDHRQA